MAIAGGRGGEAKGHQKLAGLVMIGVAVVVPFPLSALSLPMALRAW